MTPEERDVIRCAVNWCNGRDGSSQELPNAVRALWMAPAQKPGTETNIRTESVRIDAPSTKEFNFTAGLDNLTINVTHAAPQKYGFQDAFWIGFGILGGLCSVIAASELVHKLIGLIP